MEKYLNTWFSGRSVVKYLQQKDKTKERSQISKKIRGFRRLFSAAQETKMQIVRTEPFKKGKTSHRWNFGFHAVKK
ncbi:hypothetical protein EGI32_10830 [Ferruginibacter sp. HRS2-29]|nr:hypothetical protein [Ferruginibacter sp. HRS2-29]